MPTRGFILAVTCAAALLVTAPQAGAAATRAEYATQANQVCATTKADAQRIFDKYFQVRVVTGKEKVRKIPVKKALRSFRNLLASFKALGQRMLDALGAVPPAPGDEALVAAWLEKLRTAHALSDIADRRIMDGIRFLLRANPTTADDDKVLTKGEKRKVKRFQRRIAQAQSAVMREQRAASEYALQLGATECAIEDSADASSRGLHALLD